MAAATSSRWLVNAPIDLMFACGGLVWVLLALHYALAPQAFAAGPKVLDFFPLLGLFGTMLLGDTHNAASLVRLYGSEEMRRKYWYLSYAGGAAFALLACAMIAQPQLLGPLSKLYLLLIVQHVAAQAYGLAVMYCHKQNYVMEGIQASAFRWSFRTLAAYAILCQFVFPTHFRTSFFGAQMPQLIALPVWVLEAGGVASVIAVGTFVCTVAQRFARQRALPPLPSTMLLLTIAFVAATVSNASGVLSLYIPAFFHGIQYLLVSYAAERERKGLFNYSSKVFLLMVALFIAAPAMLMATGLPFGTTFLIVFLTVNLHHFLADSFIWRMRDPVVKEQLAFTNYHGPRAYPLASQAHHVARRGY